MRTTGRCPKCNSDRILEGAAIVPEMTNVGLQVVLYKDPEAVLFKGKRTGRLAAWICSSCGYTELYCPDLF